MKKKIYLVLFLILLFPCLVILTTILLLRPPKPSPEERALNLELKSFLGSDSKKTALKNLTRFEWDEVCVYLPYSISSEKFEVEGYRITSEIPVTNNDNLWAWLFKNHKTRQAFFIRSPGDYSRNHEQKMAKCFNTKVSVIKTAEIDAISKESYIRIYLQ